MRRSLSERLVRGYNPTLTSLLRVSGAGGGGGSGPSPTPGVDFIIWVTKGGNDGTGDGTDEAPFLTIGHAMTVAKSLALSATQLALVLVGPGTFAEDVRVPPFVALVAADYTNESVFVGTGSVGVPAISLDSGAWAAATDGASSVGGILTNFTLGNNLGNVVIDFTGVTSPGSFLFSAAGIAGSMTGIGDATGGGSIFLAQETVVDTNITVTGAGLEMSGASAYFGTLTLAASAAQGASMNLVGCAALVSFGSAGAITLDATAGHNVTAFLDNTSVDGTLTLKDGGGGHTSYTATVGGIPGNIVQTGGAAAPVLVRYASTQLPSKTFEIYVDKSGSDTNGNGTNGAPYLTIGKAMTVAASLLPTAAQPVLIFLGPGTYTENVSWVPWVFLTAFDQTTFSATINGNVSLNNGLWTAFSATDSPIAGFDAIEVSGNLTLNFTGCAANEGSFEIADSFAGTTIAVTGDPTGGGFLQLFNCIDIAVGATITVTGASLQSDGCNYLGDIHLVSTAAKAVFWDGSDFFGLGGTLPNVFLDASAGKNVAVTLSGSGTPGSLHLTDGGGGHTSYTATAGGIPGTIVKAGGAADPILVPYASTQLPSKIFTIYVDKSGSDTAGNGTTGAPYLTIGKALTVLATLAVSGTQAATVNVGAGQYTENLSIPPFAAIVAPDVDFTAILGNIALSAGWAGKTAFASLEGFVVSGTATIDFTGSNGSAFTFGPGSLIIGATAITGDSANGGGASSFSSVFDDVVNVTGADWETQGSEMLGLLTVASSATQPARWDSFNDSAMAGVTLNASAGHSVTAVLSATGVAGTLTLHDGGGGVTSYTATADGVPQTVSLVGGAAYPVRLTGPNAINPGALNQVITTQSIGGQLVAVWAAGGSVAWADDLRTSTNVDQWVSSISGASGLGGSVPLGTNVTITATPGGRSMIDLSLANAAFGNIIGNRLLTALGEIDTTSGIPLVIGSTAATRIDFLTSPNFRMDSGAAGAFYTAARFNIQIGNTNPDAGGARNALTFATATANATTIPTANGVIWMDTGTAGLHFTGPSGFGAGAFFDEMFLPVWNATASNTQAAKRIKLGGFATTVGAGPVNICGPIAVPLDKSVNVRTELMGRVTVAGGGASLDDIQAAAVYSAWKNVGGVVSQPTTHALGVMEQQYDPSMNPGAVGIVTSPVSGTNLQFQVTGVAGATIDWTLEIDVLYN